MSIAVSAVIKPSRLLRAALAAYAVVNLGAGLAAACAPPSAFSCPRSIAAGCLLAVAAAVLALARGRNMRRLDISGLGELRLTVQLDLPTRDGALLQLAPGSTIWPHLLLLRLRAEDGASTVLAILPDSVAAGNFRALAVALRTIAGRDNTFFGKIKIL
jgi:toxin CptA